MTPTTRPMDELREIATAICKSRTCEGVNCCQWPANGGRTKCPVKAGGYDDAARDALAAMSRVATTHAGEGMVEALTAARSFVELAYDENGGEEAADAKHVLDQIDTALSPSKPASVVAGPKWQRYKHTDKSTWPTQVGVYRVMVSGDSESLDGQTIYEYPDYPTWAEAFEDEDDGEEIVMFGQGTHDEEADTFFAYCGPISIPVFSEKALTPPQSTEEKS